MAMASSLSRLPALGGCWGCETIQPHWSLQPFQQIRQHFLSPAHCPYLLVKKNCRRSVVANSEHCSVRKVRKVQADDCEHSERPDESCESQLQRGTGRREALLAGAALVITFGSTAAFPKDANALGSSFLKDRLKERKKDTFQNLLYPIEASRVQLERVHALLDSPSLTPALYSEAKDLVQVSSRDCMPLEHYAGTQSVAAKFFEVCTFKLLVKNAVSLVDKADPKRVRTEKALVDLSRAFSELDDVLAASLSSPTSQGRERVLPVVVLAQHALDELEDGMRDALGAPLRVA